MQPSLIWLTFTAGISMLCKLVAKRWLWFRFICACGREGKDLSSALSESYIVSTLTTRLASPCEQYCYSGVDVHTPRTLTVGFMTQSLTLLFHTVGAMLTGKVKNPGYSLTGSQSQFPPIFTALSCYLAAKATVHSRSMPYAPILIDPEPNAAETRASHLYFPRLRFCALAYRLVEPRKGSKYFESHLIHTHELV
jgi:hypothetical protein